MNTTIPAVGYLRCSTDQQEESPEQQKIEILAFAKTAGYNVLRWFEDFGKSGTTFDRGPSSSVYALPLRTSRNSKQ